jgi:DNA-binding MarR family transcriptional regulator
MSISSIIFLNHQIRVHAQFDGRELSKAILKLVIGTKSEWIATGQLAESLKVSPGTVTSMLKTLSEGVGDI